MTAGKVRMLLIFRNEYNSHFIHSLSTYHIFQRRDMVLVLFISNNVYEGTGFQLRINAPGTFTTPEVNTTTERTTTPEETTTTEQATTAEPTTTTERTTTEEPTTMYELPTTPGTGNKNIIALL